VSTVTTDADTVAINTIRALCMDAVQRAGSGHPGTPMGVAPVAYTLWQRFLRFDPGDPIWPNRDRFVLSEGHASALLWSLLHLSGVRAVDPDYEILERAAVTLDDLRTFRQLGSRCPGHPEYRLTSGRVEATTGPLGQGVSTSVGMAIAGRSAANLRLIPLGQEARPYAVDGHRSEVSGSECGICLEIVRAQRCRQTGPGSADRRC
jgi:transketolase